MSYNICSQRDGDRQVVPCWRQMKICVNPVFSRHVKLARLGLGNMNSHTSSFLLVTGLIVIATWIGAGLAVRAMPDVLECPAGDT